METNLALMLSWHEGFGLTGWEAIAAELPLIVGENSGLYRLVKEELGGSGVGCLLHVDIKGRTGHDGEPNYHPDDLEAVSNAIRHVAEDMNRYINDAKTLKQQLIKKLTCTWADTGLQFLNALNPSVDERRYRPDGGPPGSTTSAPRQVVGGEGGATRAGSHRDEPDRPPAPRPDGNAMAAPTSSPHLGDAAQERRRQQEQRWKQERQSELKENIINLLGSAESLVAELEREAPPQFGLVEAPELDKNVRAHRIFDHLMDTVPFERALNWLYETYKVLSGRDRAALPEISNYLIPPLFIVSHPDEFTRLESIELGAIVQVPLGLHCFAEIVSAALEIRATRFAARETRDTRGEMAISAPPPGGPRMDIEAHLRSKLFRMLRVSSEFSNSALGTQDRRINARLKVVQDIETKQYFFTFFMDQYDIGILRRIAARYPTLAVIQLDHSWSEIHDSWWIMISLLLGHGS